jgi:hypothetical protein
MACWMMPYSRIPAADSVLLTPRKLYLACLVPPTLTILSLSSLPTSSPFGPLSFWHSIVNQAFELAHIWVGAEANLLSFSISWREWWGGVLFYDSHIADTLLVLSLLDAGFSLSCITAFSPLQIQASHCNPVGPTGNSGFGILCWPPCLPRVMSICGLVTRTLESGKPSLEF